jgi:hypothetical protein
MKKAKVKLHMKDKFMPRNILSSPYLEVVPGKKTTKVIIVGAVGVNEALNESIIVKCHGVKIKICGSNIKMNVLEHNTLEILGKIEEIKLNERA